MPVRKHKGTKPKRWETAGKVLTGLNIAGVAMGALMTTWWMLVHNSAKTEGYYGVLDKNAALQAKFKGNAAEWHKKLADDLTREADKELQRTAKRE